MSSMSQRWGRSATPTGAPDGASSSVPPPPAPTRSFGFADPVDRDALRFDRTQRLLGSGLLVVLVLGIGWFLVRGQPDTSARPDLFGGSIVLQNGAQRPPTVVDLATGKPTLQLINLGAPFGITDEGKAGDAGGRDALAANAKALTFLRADDGDFTVNRRNGVTNLLRLDHLVVNPKGGYDPGPADGTRGFTAKVDGERLFLVRHLDTDTYISVIDADIVRSAGTPDVAAPKSVALGQGTEPNENTLAVWNHALWMLVPDGTSSALLRIADAADPTATTLGQPERKGTFSGSGMLVQAGGVLAVLDPSDGSLRIVEGGPARTVTVPGMRAPSEVLVAKSEGSFWMAFLGGEGWQVAGFDPATDAASGPFLLSAGVDRAEFARPAVNGTSLWAVSRTSGRMTRVDLVTGLRTDVPGGDDYPRTFTQQAGRDASGRETFTRVDEFDGVTEPWSDITVESVGPRVVVNASVATRALLFETDTGERRVIVKSEAPELDPAAPPSPANRTPEEPDDSASSTTSTTSPDSPTTPTTAVVNTTLPCDARDQTPRKPVIQDTVPSESSVRVVWEYVPIDANDCFPSTYQVIVEPGPGTSGAVPEIAPFVSTGAVQTFTVTGLRPNRNYLFTVVAILGGQRTSSDAVSQETLETGPAPATSASSRADAPGGWQLAWDGCRGDACDQPVKYWEITPDPGACGTLADAASLTPLALVPGERFTAVATLADYPGLTGRSVAFQVVAVDDRGRTSAPTLTSCVEGWQAPTIPDGFFRSTAPVLEGGSYRVTLEIDPALATPDRMGTADPQFQFFIDDGTPLATTGRYSAQKAGLLPNTTHQGWVTVTSHGTTRTSNRIDIALTYLPFPGAGISASASVTQDSANPDNATVTGSVGGLPDGTFQAAFTIRCGNVAGVDAQPMTLVGGGGSIGRGAWNLVETPKDGCVLSLTGREDAAAGQERYDPATVAAAFAQVSTPVVVDAQPPTGGITAAAFRKAEGATDWWTQTETGITDNALIDVSYRVEGANHSAALLTPAVNCEQLAPPSTQGLVTLRGPCFADSPDPEQPASTNLTLQVRFFGATQLLGTLLVPDGRTGPDGKPIPSTTTTTSTMTTTTEETTTTTAAALPLAIPLGLPLGAVGALVPGSLLTRRRLRRRRFPPSRRSVSSSPHPEHP